MPVLYKTAAIALLLCVCFCSNTPVTVARPGVLDGNRFVRVENLTAAFNIRHSGTHRFFYGKGSRRARDRDRRLQNESTALDGYVQKQVRRKLVLTGFSPVNTAGTNGRPAGLVFRGAMNVELTRGFLLDSARVTFRGELLSLEDGRVVASGLVKEGFLPGSPRKFADLLNDELDRPIRVWFETLDRG